MIFSDFKGRAERTVPPIMSTVTAPIRTAGAARSATSTATSKGTIDSDGSSYHAMNPELFYWAHATFVDQVIYVTDTFIRRLSYAEKAQMFESKRWYALYGVNDRAEPQTYEEFLAYWDGCSTASCPPRPSCTPPVTCVKGLPRPKRVPAPVWRWPRFR